jgi:two-component system CitB family sensor kinase
LIDNAIESVAATSRPQGHVDVSIAVEDDELVLRVHDSGPGITPGLADEIFRHGFTTKVAGEGMRRGLGLALVAQVVKRRRGRIAVENVDGALFTVALPLHDVEVPSTEFEHAAS